MLFFGDPNRTGGGFAASDTQAGRESSIRVVVALKVRWLGPEGARGPGPSWPSTPPGGRLGWSVLSGHRERALCFTRGSTAESRLEMKDRAPGNPKASDVHCLPCSPRHPRRLAAALSLGLTLNLERHDDRRSVHL